MPGESPNRPSSKPRPCAIVPLVGILLITVLSVLTSQVGWHLLLEQLSHFKLQYLVVNLILLGVLIGYGQRRAILIGLFCVAVILGCVLPWYFPATASQSGGDPLLVLFSNVYVQNQDYDRILQLIRQENPDIAVLTETFGEWRSQLAPLDDLFPYSTRRAGLVDSGILIFSRLPLENVRSNFFGTDQTGFKRATLLADLSLNGQKVAFIATHPLPPVSTAVFRSRNRQLEGISQYVKGLKRPVFMVGDLNITLWSPYYRKFEHVSGLHNARRGFGLLPSWRPMKIRSIPFPSALSWLLAIPIDHCLISREVAVRQIRTGRDIGSDHLPLIVDLLPPPVYEPRT